MAELPYGFDGVTEGILDDPWTKLATINEHMEARKPIPSHLARWLGTAIDEANGDADALVRRLGLKKRGKPSHKWSAEQAHDIGKRICEIEDEDSGTVSPEQAINTMLNECAQIYGDQMPSRASLQRWRDQYRDAKAEARRP